ncbi:hypothetical protein G7Y89_g5247 [Cudoniella acicularis]|uniref:Regulator of chromosome condensation-like protein n=1 Tax=Cudoniella acicularis TaxID=354080 RepID=A0A8H4W3J7_9HELO|nr:hypothetical protein G7Y89_g5247 [Cudoniella acicularis]
MVPAYDLGPRKRRATTHVPTVLDKNRFNQAFEPFNYLLRARVLRVQVNRHIWRHRQLHAQTAIIYGNFDNPRASDSSHETADQIIRDILDNTRSPEEVSPSGELYRFIERFHRSRGTENRTAQQLPSLQTMSESDSNRRRRQQHRDSEGSPLFVLPSQPQSSDPSPRERAAARLASISSRRGRPRLMASDRYLERHRAALAEASTSADRSTIAALANLRDAGGQLEAVSAAVMQDTGRHLEVAHALFNNSVPNLPSPSQDPDYSGDVEPSRRAKRRKLDSDKLDTGFAGFSYGKYGQVEPGKLKMEIVSCDGGIFEEHPGVNYSAENLLQNDDTVYCTKSNRCNLILRHQGATVFCLKELVIKAPHTGYTAPVQEGMVFISMTSDDLLTRTARYQIQYSPPRARQLGSERSSDLPPILSIRHNGDGSMSTAQARARRLVDIGVQDEECDFRTAQIPSDFTSNPPPFQVTTEWSDSEDEESTSLSRRHITRRIGLRYDEPDSGDDADEQNNSANWHEDYILGMGRSARLQRRETARNITLAEAAEASQIATQEAVKAVGGDLMVPHARFFIERDKSKCTLKFDPPVSGRFILLKMWSPHSGPSGNIDIESVVAKGFAGPRFFPAITLR